MELFYIGSIVKKDTKNVLRNYNVYKDGDYLQWELTQDKYALFGTQDFNLLIQKEWRAQRDNTFGSRDMFYVLCRTPSNPALGAHRYLAGLEPSDVITVDHKNQNGLDNRRCNLRLATKEQQVLNHDRVGVRVGEDFSNPYRGVIRRSDNGRFRVRASVLGKQHNLGHFHCPVKAAECWDEFIYEGYKNHNPLVGVDRNGITGEPTINFIHFNFPERLGIKI